MNFEECVEYISNWFFADTVELLDQVLEDDIADPQYSAITTLNRIFVYLQYKRKLDKAYEDIDIASLLEESGYTIEDIALFRKKAQEEYKIYTADILDKKFFEECVVKESILSK